MANRERNISLDALRCVSCLFIVFMHSVMPAPPQYGILVSSFNTISCVGIGAFFFISGYLLLPVKTDTVTFLKRRFTRLLWPLLLWSVIYYCVDICCGDRSFIWADLIKVPLYGGSPIMWFVYVILGLYLVSPIVSPWLEKASRHEATIYLGIFLLPYAMCVFFGTNTLYMHTHALYYFAGYGAYFFYGWYVKRYGWRLKMRWYALGFVLSLAVIVACRLLHVQVDYYKTFWAESIFQFVMTAFVARLIMCNPGVYARLGRRAKETLVTISNLTLGVYLTHFILVRRLLWHWSWIEGIECFPLQTAVVVTLTLILSLGLCWLISLTPLGKYVIGYSRR